MAKYDYVSVDVETTGLNHQNDEVIEVTAIEFNLNGEMGETITQLCKPLSGFIPPHITAINNITWEMVNDKPYFLKDGIREKVAGFFGRRIVVGHNVIKFDIKFLKIDPKAMEDTLLMCRKRYPGGNKLKTACQRISIQWDDKLAHRSEYDVIKCIELFVKLKEMDAQEKEQVSTAPLFAQEDSDKIKSISHKLGVIPTENDKEIFATQAYSYSRISLFHQCKFKWYMQYIKKVKQPDVDYLITGKICHKIAEWSGQWCYRELIANKMEVYARKQGIDIIPDLRDEAAKDLNIDTDKVGFKSVGRFFYRHPERIKTYFKGLDGLAALIYELDNIVVNENYENPSMPDIDTYNNIINTAINRVGCNNPDIIKDVRYIMDRFYQKKDFSMVPGDIILTEKRIAFDKCWKLLADFFSNKAFFRGVIDVIAYITECIIITDYKTSRKLITVEQLREDIQMKIYFLLIYHFMPKGSYNRIIVRVEFLRFNKTVEYEVTDIKSVADEALKWINDSIKLIETEMLKTGGNAFEPERNEFCHTIFLGDEGRCPLFDKRFINNINDPERFVVTDIEDCQTAWKRVEANKSENKRLTSQCKVFMHGCTDAVTIDKHAKLDFYVTEFREYNSLKTMQLLIKKGLKISDFINYFGITEASVKKLIDRKEIELKDDELDLVSKKKTKSQFDAFTEKEAKNSKFLNA